MDEIWDLEERFWLAGIEHFQAEMHPDCIMALPAPVGILSGASIVAAVLHAAKRSCSERHLPAAAKQY